VRGVVTVDARVVITRARERSRLLAAAAIAVVGVGLSVSPYLWLDAWQSYGFGLDLLAFQV